ncbi:MAG: hypothetical protein ACT4QE_16505 [Anaerolineales bacterium]
MSPLIPLAILLVGTGVLALTWLPRFPLATAVSLATVLCALIATGLLLTTLPARAVLSDWTAVNLLPIELGLRVDGQAWLLAMGLLALMLAALLTGLARPGGPRVAVRVAMLLLTFSGLAALFAENIITLLIAWASLDFLYFLTLILLARGEGVQPQAVLHLTFNSFGTLLMLASALIIGQNASDFSLQAAATRQSTTLLITLAAVFRLGLFPLHLGLPLDVNVRQGLGVLLRLIPATVALDVVARLAALGFTEPARPWLTLFGVAAIWVGASQLWNTEDTRQGLPSVIIAQSSLALLAGLWGGAQAGAAVVALALALLLGGGLMYLSQGFDRRGRWWSVLPAIGGAALLGLPFTIGFSGLYVLYTAWQTSFFVVLLAVVGAQALLAVGLLRTMAWPAEPLEGGALERGAHLAGLIGLASAAILSGLFVEPLGAGLGLRGLTGLGLELNWGAVGLIVLTLAIGVGLWRYESFIRARTETAATLAFSILRLDWLYRWVWLTLQGLGRVIETAAGVLEGEGAMLWALVVALAVVLLFR